jgi:uncharacterized membrane protein YhhN
MISTGLCLMVTGLAGTLFLEVRQTGKDTARFLVKGVASTGFIVLALSGFNQTPYALWVLAALVCSWLGDVLLAGSQKILFLLGLCSFLLAHILFAMAFWSLELALSRTILVLLPVLALSACIGFWLFPHVERNMKKPVIFYVLAISFMVFSAFLVEEEYGMKWIASAAVLFFISDLFVARQRFIKRTSLNRLVGLPLYYAAQGIFAWSLTGFIVG